MAKKSSGNMIPMRGKHKHGECVASCDCVECREAFSPRERYDAKQALAEAAGLLVLTRMAEAKRDAKRSARIAAKVASKYGIKHSSGQRLARRTKQGLVPYTALSEG